MPERPPGYWSKFKVTPEWLAECVAALTDSRAEEFRRLRGFPSVPSMKRAMPMLGWFNELGRWVLPIFTVEGQVYAVKAWKPTGTKWITIGWDHAKAAGNQEHPMGRLFGMDWVVDHIKEDEGGKWLWMTAGEHDTIMLRCFGWFATTLTQGESSKPNSDMLLREFGKEQTIEMLISYGLRGIVVTFDCDDAGRNGAVWLCDALERMLSMNKIAVTEAWQGVKAVDLRKLPGWVDDEAHIGWDVSDMLRWARANKVHVAKRLLEMANNNVAGHTATAELLGVHDVTSAPTLASVLVPSQMHMTNIEDLLAFGLSYARKIGSRGEGCYHMGIWALRTGWSRDELHAEDVAAQYKAMVDAQITKGDVKPLTEYEYEIDRSYLNMGGTEDLCNDVANVKRLAWYWPFLKFHPPRKRWLWWSGKFWLDDETKIMEHCSRIGDYIAEEAKQALAKDDQSLAKRLYGWAHTSRSAPRITALIKMAEKSPLFRPMPEYGEAWDADGLVIGTPDGVFDLVAGVLLEPVAGRNKWCSMTTAGRILLGDSGFQRWGDKWAEGWALWRRVLSEWHDDAEVVDLLQDIFGMALRGQLVERIFYFYGSGRSGKSAILDAMASAMGMYAYEIMGAALTKGKEDNTRGSSIAMGYGRRLVKITETGAKLLDTDVLKMLTGETQLVGKALYHDVTVGQNNATYVMMSNNEPDLAGDQSEALRNRLVVIPWKRTFIDRTLMENPEYVGGVADGTVMMKSDSLKYELMGRVSGFEMMPDVVLTWAFAGLQRVMERSGGPHGSELVLPAAIAETTAIVWDESDMISMYFRECGMFTEGGETIIATQGLWQKMKEWATVAAPTFASELGDNPRVLGQMLRHRAGRGYRPTRVTNTLWKGEDDQPRGWAVPWTWKG